MAKPYHLLSDERKRQIARGVTESRRRKKAKAIKMKGGCCLVCSYDRCAGALQFHHVDPSQKDFHLAAASAWSWERIAAELQKCVLLCANCHAEVHDGIIDLRDHLSPEEFDRMSKPEEKSLGVMAIFIEE